MSRKELCDCPWHRLTGTGGLYEKLLAAFRCDSQLLYMTLRYARCRLNEP